VSIDYYAADPLGQTDTWLAANKITCLAGGGTYATPSFALFQSSGSDQMSGSWGSIPTRTLRATYVFVTSNANIPGGLIHVYKTATSTDLCIDAGSSAPTAGTNVTLQPCVSGSSQQKFSYNSNLTISLVTSKTSAVPLGMCLDAGSPESSGLSVKLQTCSSITKPQQQWSINDASNLQGTSDGLTLNSFCFNAQTPNVPGSLLVLSTNCYGGYDTTQTFQLEASVGAGAAGTSSTQLVNFNQFGRCMDVTEFNVNYGYLIDWPCKQAPNPTAVGWNQRWTLPALSGLTTASGRITTSNGSTLYCLTSPLSTGGAQYVQVQTCPANTTTSTTWTVTGDTGIYATSYIVRDSAGYCLSPTNPNASPPDLYPNGLTISKIIVATCDGSTLQKWNAPPNLLIPSPLKDVNEK
jgi:hypothetical protein